MLAVSGLAMGTLSATCRFSVTLSLSGAIVPDESVSVSLALSVIVIPFRSPLKPFAPLIEMADPEAGEPYALTLNFTEVIR